jgi:hypothetical protein
MAHFHIPKPLHGWREFAGEVGIIVLGVLIALGAEQVVETVSWHHHVAEAEAAMTTELGFDDGSQAEARLTLSSCITQHLQQLQGGLIAERDRGVPFSSPRVAVPAFRTWDDNAWRAAVSSGATAHMSTRRMGKWSAAYAFIPDMNEAAVRETADWGDLARVGLLRPHPSENEREAMLTAIGRARHDNDLLTRVSTYFLIFTHRAGVRVPAAAAREELARERREMGTC